MTPTSPPVPVLAAHFPSQRATMNSAGSPMGPARAARRNHIAVAQGAAAQPSDKTRLSAPHSSSSILVSPRAGDTARSQLPPVDTQPVSSVRVSPRGRSSNAAYKPGTLGGCWELPPERPGSLQEQQSMWRWQSPWPHVQAPLTAFSG